MNNLIRLSCLQHRNIDAVLNRGEKIDVLVDRSNDLNTQSKLFYKQVCVFTI